MDKNIKKYIMSGDLQKIVTLNKSFMLQNYDNLIRLASKFGQQDIIMFLRKIKKNMPIINKTTAKRIRRIAGNGGGCNCGK